MRTDLFAIQCMIVLLGLSFESAISDQQAISFARDIRPVLSEHCFTCHGPDQATRKADLRLDVVDFINTSSEPIIVPGDPDASLLFQRITHLDPDERMPPESVHRPLNQIQIDLIRQWIENGAAWETHWSFATPTPQDPPHIDGIKHPIDAFIQSRLNEDDLTPHAQAAPELLMRRLSLDLTGLPPTSEELDAWLVDSDDTAWNVQVDRLLASPRYGEHQARYWLDASRYADTHGYHLDNERTMWKYRDWVVRAFNDNMPYDQFTVEQLAGDLLEEPTIDQLVASGFNRCHSTTNEGGAIKDEYLVKYVVDRVEATSTIWMGLTMGCAACHEHKYDPITQREFYELFAFFNNTAEDVMDGNAKQYPPIIQVPDAAHEEQRKAIETRLDEARGVLDDPDPTTIAAMTTWVQEQGAREQNRWSVFRPFTVATEGGSELQCLEDGSLLSVGSTPADEVYELVFVVPAGKPIHALRLEALQHPSLPKQGPGLNPDNGNIVLSEIELEAFPASEGLLGSSDSSRIEFSRAIADYSQPDYDITAAIDGQFGEVNGWAILKDGKPGERVAIFSLSKPIEFESDTILRLRMHAASKWKRHALGCFRLGFSHDPDDLAAASSDWEYAGPFPAETVPKLHEARFQPEQVALETSPEWTPKPEYVDGKVHAFGTESPAAHYVRRTIYAPSESVLRVSLGSDDGLDVLLNGERIFENDTPRGAAPDQDQVDLPLQVGANELMLRIDNFGGACGFYYQKLTEQDGMPIDVGRALAVDSSVRTDEQDDSIQTYYLRSQWPVGVEAATRIDAADKEMKELDGRIPTTYISREMDERRQTYVLNRGQYDQPGEPVEPNTPSCLPPMTDDMPRNRLGFARWLVQDDHPLTARVTVNRIWQQYFGTGLVVTSENFGVQGSQPSHPELLDWLSLWFIEHDWDLKALHRLIVTSETYRMSSQSTSNMQALDPENTLLTRFPRHRLDAETVRDQALAISGLLVEQHGGPGVKPYQPTGLWKAVGYSGSNTVAYMPDTGDALWRRSLYTFWKRTSPPPSMTLLDAPSREFCTVRRERTNTPLAALLLLNDVQYMEAARAFGQRIILEGGGTDESRASWAFRMATSRIPTSEELAVLMALFEEQRADFQSDPVAAQALIEVGNAPRDESLDPATHAAWTMVANLVFNLDETISKG